MRDDPSKKIIDSTATVREIQIDHDGVGEFTGHDGGDDDEAMPYLPMTWAQRNGPLLAGLLVMAVLGWVATMMMVVAAWQAMAIVDSLKTSSDRQAAIADDVRRETDSRIKDAEIAALRRELADARTAAAADVAAPAARDAADVAASNAAAVADLRAAFDRLIDGPHANANANANTNPGTSATASDFYHRGMLRLIDQPGASADVLGARADFERAISLDAMDWRFFVALGRADARTDNAAAAERAFSTALNLAPKADRAAIIAARRAALGVDSDFDSEADGD